MKLLRRHIIAREAEFKKIKPQALRCGYHRIDWHPITITELKKRAAWQVLTGVDIGDDPMFSTRELRLKLEQNKIFLSTINDDEKFARVYINYLQHSKRLYNKNWEHWSWRFDNDSIMIRWAQTQPWAPMGFITLERDY